MGDKTDKNTTSFLPFFGTDIGQCSLIKPGTRREIYMRIINLLQLVFTQNRSIRDLPWDQKMFSGFNGLTILLDAETYDYMYQVEMLKIVTLCIL